MDFRNLSRNATFLNWGFESGKTRGLNLVAGKVSKLNIKDRKIKLPHVGWNNINLKNNIKVLNNINLKTDFYFVHSFECILDNPDEVLTTSFYEYEFTSSLIKNNIIGMQFHPEKSSPNGLKILKIFQIWNNNC